MPIVNSASIIRKAQAAIDSGAKSTQIRAILQEKGDKAARDIRDVLEYQLDNHPVTKELTSSNTNTSRFLSYGNIKAYFGLSDTKVKEDISVMKGLMGNFKVTIVKPQGTANYIITITFPQIEKYYDITPAPSDSYGVSWLRALEMGLLQNFTHFLFRTRGFPRADSRSGTGIQVVPFLHRGSLNTIPSISYITDVYKKVLGNKAFIKEVISTIKFK